MKYLALFALVVFSYSCKYSKSGSGNIITETRNVNDFSAISVSQAIEVDIQQGTQTSVQVEADDNIMSYVETVNKGGELSIRLKNMTNIRNATVKVHITAPNVESFTTASSAKIKSIGLLSSSNQFEIDASSASKISLQMQAPSIKMESSSAAELNISGKTRDANVEASSGSSIDAQNLKAENVTASGSSGSTVKVFASVSIDASSSSGSNIIFIGGAPSVKKNESSGGSVSNN
jgi:hypothetical protein